MGGGGGCEANTPEPMTYNGDKDQWNTSDTSNT